MLSNFTVATIFAVSSVHALCEVIEPAVALITEKKSVGSPTKAKQTDTTVAPVVGLLPKSPAVVTERVLFEDEFGNFEEGSIINEKER